MTWPNSLAVRPSPTMPSTFPGVGRPANDNWRTPFPKGRPPMAPPANDNIRRPWVRSLASKARVSRSAGLFLRSLGLIGTLYTAYELYRQADEFYNSVGPIEGYWPVFDSRFVVARYQNACYAEPGTLMGQVSAACAVQQVPSQDGPYNRPVEPVQLNPGGSFFFRMYTDEGPATETQNLYHARGQAYQVTYPFLNGPGAAYIEFDPVREAKPMPMPRPWSPPAPVPWLVPPLAQPGAAPRLKPGYADNRSQPLMPEDSSAGYGPSRRPALQPDFLPSRPPRGREKEIKFRAKNSSAGRAIEWAIGMATEGLDWSRALFEALPYWRKMEIINRYRTLEIREGRGGFSAQARLRYVPLNPAEMLAEVYKYQHEIAMADLVTNIWTMLGSDRAWGQISQSMGRYQRGPWDSPRDMPRVEPEWETYLPWLEPDTVHDRAILEDAVGEPLTDKEIDRLYRQWERWSNHRPFDPGQLNR